MCVVSVIMSVYNGEKYVRDAIDSVLTQSYSDFEFVIIDDGSTDGSARILRNYAEGDSRVQLIEQANTGLTVALRRGVEASRGIYIARMDADDISLPGRLAKQTALLESDHRLVAVSCDVEHFFDDGSVSHVASRIGEPRLLPLYNCFANRIGGHGQVMFRRSAYDAACGYDASIYYAQDYDLWMRLTEHGFFGFVDDILYRFRTGHDSISSRSKSGQEASAIHLCQREYEKLTAVPLSKETALAMMNFWSRSDPYEVTVGQSIDASRAMDKAVRTFFTKNPRLCDKEFHIRREICALWRWRMKECRPGDWSRKSAMTRNFVFWGAKAFLRGKKWSIISYQP